MIIQDSSMVNNSAELVGGAINLVSSLLKFSGDNYIENNMARLQSGGLNTFLVSRIIFTGNIYFINNYTADSFGGAFSTTLTNVSVHDTRLILFNNNGCPVVKEVQYMDSLLKLNSTHICMCNI